MQPFKDWINSNKNCFAENVYQLFRDSEKCFCNELYRPAYLLAYQGMLLHFREVMIKGKKPNNIVEDQWTAYLRKLKLTDDARIDDKMFEFLKQDQDANKVFIMPNNIREQFTTWRLYRNVCAHYKPMNFEAAHVMVFYSFIEEQLFKISLEGGTQSLLNAFEAHFDKTITAPDADIQPLVDKIVNMVSAEEYPKFWKSLNQLIEYWDIPGFWRGMLERTTGLTHDKLLSWLQGTTSVKKMVITQYPELTSLLLQKTNVREFWQKELYEIPNPWPVIAELIRSGMVPAEEREELIRKYIEFAYKYNRVFNCNDDDWQLLLQVGVLNEFYNYYGVGFTTIHLKEVCYKTDFYMSILNHIDVDKEFVERTLDIFEQNSPYTLEDRMRDEFFSNDEKWKTFSTIAQRMGRVVPNKICRNN